MRARRPPRVSLGFAGLTPLVDTLFLLLFSLLILSDTRRSHATELIRIALPEVEPGDEDPAADGARIVLEIAADSTVRFLEPDVLVRSRDELDRALAALLSDLLPEEVTVEIRADRDARHGVAVELLQHLRLRGFLTVQLVAVGREGSWGPFGGER